MVRAEPERFPLAIFLMNRGTSICVGQAPAQGASKQKRHRFASVMAACLSNGGCRSPNRAEVSALTGTCCTKDVWPDVMPLIGAKSSPRVAALSGSETIIMHYPHQNSRSLRYPR